MRTLSFIVTVAGGIRKDPTCSFSGLRPKPEEPIRVEFTFPDSWERSVKVVGFYNRDHQECEPRALDDNNSCEIPAEVMMDFVFYMRVYGRSQRDTFATELTAVCLDGR